MTEKPPAYGAVPSETGDKVRSLASPFDGNWLYWASRKGDYPGVSPHLAQLLKLYSAADRLPLKTQR